MSDLLKFVARIFVPPKAATGRSGTAYPIAPDRVITAAHVLKGEGDAETWHKSADVLWNQHEETIDLDWQPAKVLWNGHDEGFDIAVLETTFPPQIRGYAEASWTPPPTGREFDIRGFAAVGKRDDGRQAVPFQGKVLAYLPIDEEISIGISFGPELEDGWKGASGSPVIIDNSLYAVFVKCPFGLGARQVHVLPIHRLIRNQRFLDAAGLSAEQIDEYRRTEATKSVAAHLLAQSVFTAGLIDKLKEQGCAPADVDDANDQQRAETVAALLCSRTLKPKTTLEATLATVRATRTSMTPSDARQVLKIISLVLPVAGEGIGSLTLSTGPEEAILSLDAVSQTMAELALARLGNRAAEFSSRDATGDLPRGKRALTSREVYTPEVGARSTSEGMGREAIGHLAGKLIDGKPLLQEEARRLQWNVCVEVLRRNLRRHRKDRGCIYYSFSPKEDAEYEGKLSKIAKEISKQLPELLCVRLRGPDERYLEEFDQLELLGELLEELERSGGGG